MTDPADLVREACALLGDRLFPTLEGLLAEPSAELAAPGMTPRAPEAPEPWNAQAGRALMDGLEGIRRLKALLLYLGPAGHPGPRHGMSKGNTQVVLRDITRLAAGREEQVLRVLERWINEARCVPAIDEAPRWRPLPGRACPYCGYWALKADMDRRPVQVVCFCQWCPGDENGLRPLATMGTDEHGIPGLLWKGGRWETALEMEA